MSGTQADQLWKLILSDDEAEISRLEQELGTTRNAVFYDFLETSCWSEDVPHLTGGKGSPVERLSALRQAYTAQNQQAPKTEFNRLTPLEYQLAEALQVTFPNVPDSATDARALIEHAMDREHEKLTGK